MAHLPDILDRIQETGGWNTYNFESKMEQAHVGNHGSPRMSSPEELDAIWRHSISSLLQPANSVIELMNDGLEHAGLQLELIPRPEKKKFFSFLLGFTKLQKTDIEADQPIIKPGHPKFSVLLEEKLEEFVNRRAEALTAWANSKGLPSARLDQFQQDGDFCKDGQPTSVHVYRDHQQLYLILYIQHMVSNTRTIRWYYVDELNFKLDTQHRFSCTEPGKII